MKFLVEVKVVFKNGVRDPQGDVLSLIFSRMKIDDNAKISTGKFFSVLINADSPMDAEEKIRTVCAEVLSDPVQEDYEILVVKQV